MNQKLNNLNVVRKLTVPHIILLLTFIGSEQGVDRSKMKCSIDFISEIQFPMDKCEIQNTRIKIQGQHFPPNQNLVSFVSPGFLS